MHPRGKKREGGNIALLCHNIKSINGVKLQQCLVVSAEEGATACVMLCLQETKLLQVRLPYGYAVEHCPRPGKSGGGIATLILSQVPMMKSVKEQFVVYTQLAAD